MYSPSGDSILWRIVAQKEDGWRSPERPPTLQENNVHVWRVSLQPSPGEIARRARLLSADERERAARFVFQRHRRRYIAARGALRLLLSHYLALPPASLFFSYSYYAKPYLADGCGDGRLQFNVSHSHELALLAFTYDRRLGVDVERRREVSDAEALARHYFSTKEIEALAATPAEQRSLAFLQGWTRKEAYIKAIGEGLSRPLDSFDVALGPGRPAALLAVRSDPTEAARWRLVALAPHPQYVAALAVEGQEWQLSRWTFDGRAQGLL